MPDIINQPVNNERIKAIKELIQVIDEYLKMSDDTTRKENIANCVYFLFAPHDVDIGTNVFSPAAASALCVFSTNKKIRNYLKKLCGNDFYFLCELLQKVVEFCCNIRSEANLARLDKSKWECDDTAHISLEDILEEKSKYGYKLKFLRERIQRTNR